MKNFENVRLMSCEELETVIKADNRETMCAVLGTFIGAKSSASEIVKKANLYVKAIDIWKQNWQTLIEYNAPKAKEDLKAETTKLVERLKKAHYTDEQIADALAMVKSA